MGDPKRRVLTSAGLIEPYLDASADAPSRFSSLAFHLATHDEEQGKDLLPASPAPARSFGPRLRTQWGRWQARTNVVASPVGRVHALCALATVDGRQLLAASTRHGIGVWDSTTGQQLTHIDTGVAHGLTVAKGTSGRPFLVAAGPAARQCSIRSRAASWRAWNCPVCARWWWHRMVPTGGRWWWPAGGTNWPCGSRRRTWSSRSACLTIFACRSG